MRSGLTQSRLKGLFLYDPETGVFTNRVSRGSRAVKSDPVGSIGSGGYLNVMVEGRNYGLHRLAFLYMTGKWPKGVAGHTRGSRTDNRWEQLSDISHADNSKDRKIPSNSKSGVMGVCGHGTYADGSIRWQADIQVNGKKKYLYSGKDFEKACKLRREAEIKYNYHEDHGKRR